MFGVPSTRHHRVDLPLTTSHNTTDITTRIPDPPPPRTPPIPYTTVSIHIPPPLPRHYLTDLPPPTPPPTPVHPPPPPPPPCSLRRLDTFFVTGRPHGLTPDDGRCTQRPEGGKSVRVGGVEDTFHGDRMPVKPSENSWLPRVNVTGVGTPPPRPEPQPPPLLTSHAVTPPAKAWGRREAVGASNPPLLANTSACLPGKIFKEGFPHTPRCAALQPPLHHKPLLPGTDAGSATSLRLTEGGAGAQRTKLTSPLLPPRGRSATPPFPGRGAGVRLLFQLSATLTWPMQHEHGMLWGTPARIERLHTRRLSYAMGVGIYMVPLSRRHDVRPWRPTQRLVSCATRMDIDLGLRFRGQMSWIWRRACGCGPGDSRQAPDVKGPYHQHPLLHQPPSATTPHRPAGPPGP